ncbi:DUF2721 domain-containing protein [Vampirovibrio sp.]|uniref:DUF2721 domain-containing protein n=1 Tax=Vampirovibrio sp. TaxID=2717857 RepID=UPI0035943816
MITANSIITESLAPAVTITGLALLLNGVNGRFSTAATRVRELNRELRTSTSPTRIANIRQQVPLFMRRIHMIRNAVFVMFGALGLMVFSAVSIALYQLHFVKWEMVPVWSFLGGLLLMLLAVIIETYETTLNLRTLALDVDNGLEQTSSKTASSAHPPSEPLLVND